jgi:hypothetical protein
MVLQCRLEMLHTTRVHDGSRKADCRVGRDGLVAVLRSVSPVEGSRRLGPYGLSLACTEALHLHVASPSLDIEALPALSGFR